MTYDLQSEDGYFVIGGLFRVILEFLNYKITNPLWFKICDFAWE